MSDGEDTMPTNLEFHRWCGQVIMTFGRLMGQGALFFTYPDVDTPRHDEGCAGYLGRKLGIGAITDAWANGMEAEQVGRDLVREGLEEGWITKLREIQ